MDEIRRRTNVTHALLSGRTKTLYHATTVESAALQLRKILELIALGSLVAHVDECAKHYESFAKHWHAARILRDVEQINPLFYPQPIKEVRTGHNTTWKNLKDGFLTKSEFIELYDSLGDVMHAKNPFAPPLDYRHFEQMIRESLVRVSRLLCTHLVHLYKTDRLIITHMREASDGRVHGYIFGKVKGK